MGDDTIKRNISKNIVKYREMSGMSQKELAKKLGVVPSRISNWETGANCPSIDILFEVCEILNVSINDIYGIYPDSKFVLEYSEQELIKQYRHLDTYGQETINIALNRESQRVEQIKRASASTLVEFSSTDNGKRFVEYFHSASAGTGIFILGNEAAEQIAIPDIPEYKSADYAIKVNGISMEPDYSDGDIVLVSQNEEMEYGDVGIFIVNNEAFIKEYGEKELISRNPNCSNIKISEYDNIVCMGKVIDKLN